MPSDTVPDGVPAEETQVWTLGPMIVRADVPALCERLARAPTTTVICDLSELARVDAVTVEALARLHLTARRLNRRLIVRGADDRLLTLLTFLGLRDVLPFAPPDGPAPAER